MSEDYQYSDTPKRNHLKAKDTGVVSFEENSSFEKQRKKIEQLSNVTPEETKRS